MEDERSIDVFDGSSRSAYVWIPRDKVGVVVTCMSYLGSGAITIAGL